MGFFWVENSLGGPNPGKVRRGRLMVLANGMWSKQKGMSVVKWSKVASANLLDLMNQQRSEDHQLATAGQNYLIRPNRIKF